MVLKFLVEFISLVVDRQDMNKMTAANLAVVFGPNLAWSNDKTMVSRCLLSQIIFWVLLIW